MSCTEKYLCVVKIWQFLFAQSYSTYFITLLSNLQIILSRMTSLTPQNRSHQSYLNKEVAAHFCIGTNSSCLHQEAEWSGRMKHHPSLSQVVVIMHVHEAEEEMLQLIFPSQYQVLYD
jgi:hypothetical protein